MFSGPGHITRLEQAQRARLGIESIDNMIRLMIHVLLSMLAFFMIIEKVGKKSLEKPVRNISCWKPS